MSVLTLNTLSLPESVPARMPHDSMPLRSMGGGEGVKVRSMTRARALGVPRELGHMYPAREGAARMASGPQQGPAKKGGAGTHEGAVVIQRAPVHLPNHAPMHPMCLLGAHLRVFEAA